ncbi:hypothetical protein NPIL_417871 [Nephila pilipes]|uniref:Uncharacterized protein n=1 Tax=Nephila pilipes TaxID=299642 RepID=A0A8X6TDT4_NEPPI|nr:hypothetical protein NPIL_417871 [Nephila pilipes]
MELSEDQWKLERCDTSRAKTKKGITDDFSAASLGIGNALQRWSLCFSVEFIPSLFYPIFYPRFMREEIYHVFSSFQQPYAEWIFHREMSLIFSLE